MSDTTTFELRIAGTALAAFCQDLAPLVEAAGDCPTTEASGPSAGALLQQLSTLAVGDYREACLTLGFPADAGLRRFQAEHPELRAGRPDRVAVGCFWLGCRLADGQYRVSFTSATRAIASLMQCSDSVRHSFRALARHAQDGEVQVINEWHEASRL